MVKVPFWAHPKSWRLSRGTYSYSKARVEYEYSDSYEKKLALLNLELDYNRKTLADHTTEKFKLDYEYNKNNIPQRKYEKEMANLKGEIYFNDNARYVETEEGSGTIVFDLDWNDKFVEYLRDQGYDAPTAEQAVDMWFTNLCKQVGGEEEFAEDLDIKRTWNKRTKLCFLRRNSRIL